MRVVIIVAFFTRSRADVVCGGHTAVTCDLCPQGNGAAWCNMHLDRRLRCKLLRRRASVVWHWLRLDRNDGVVPRGFIGFRPHGKRPPQLRRAYTSHARSLLVATG